MKAVLSVLIAGFFMAAPAEPPAEPDFSGEWVLASANPVTPLAATTLSVQQPIVRTTAFGTPMEPFFSELIVDRSFPTGTRSESFKIGIQSGNGTFSGADWARSQSTELVRWVGRTLLIETTIKSVASNREATADAERQEIWQLDEHGRLVISLRVREGSAQSQTAILTYRRK